MELLILFGTLIALLILGVPVAFSLGLSSLATMWYLDIPAVVVFQRMAAGMNDFIRKPISRKKVYESLEKWLNRE